MTANRPTTESLVKHIHDTCATLETVRIMEVCGTHTVSLFRSGVRSMMPENLHLISGPGCPVCVTSQGYIDAACDLADRPDVTICTYGDMVRVPGRTGSLQDRRADGADVVVVYSARDALQYARNHADRQVVFLAVGFETTTPPTAAVVTEARRDGLTNFSVFASHKLVIPAISALLSAGDTAIDGFLCPGHVSVIIGAAAYRPIAEQYGKPCVVAGFEPRQMLEGIVGVVEQVEAGRAEVQNVYPVAVSEAGNAAARAMVDAVFVPADAEWRAIGTIPDSGLRLRDQFAGFDAAARFELTIPPDYQPPGCLCGQVIQGKACPAECDLFGKVCTPIKPIGPCMVSSEGTCAAWYKYGRA